MASNAVNLDHLIVIIDDNREGTGRKLTVALTQFLAHDDRVFRSPIRVASHFDYASFRAYLEEKNITQSTPLQVDGSESNITDHASFLVLLTKIQSGQHVIKDLTLGMRVPPPETPHDEPEPAQEKPVQEEPAQEEPTQEEPTQEEPAKEEPAQEEPAKEEPAQEEPAHDDPLDDEYGDIYEASPTRESPGGPGEHTMEEENEQDKDQEDDEGETEDGVDNDSLPGPSGTQQTGSPSREPTTSSPPSRTPGKTAHPATVDKGKGVAGPVTPRNDKGKGLATSTSPETPSSASSYHSRRAEEGIPDNEPEWEEEENGAEFVLGGVDLGIGSPSDAEWTLTCIFFNCNEDVNNITIPGLNMRLPPHQMQAIYAILRQQSRQRISLMLADDVGLGKTGMTIASTLIQHQLQVAWSEVSAARKAKRPTHLPDDHNGPDAVCPSANEGRYGFQCPCIPDGESARLVKALSPSPCVILIKPDHIQEWADEVDKWIDFSSTKSAANQMSYTVHRTGGWRNEKNPRSKVKNHDLEATNNTRAVVRFLEEESAEYEIVPRTTPQLQSRHVIITSQFTIQGLYDSYKQTFKRPHRRTQLSVNNFTVGFMFMDEVHGYKGTRKQPTRPFQILDLISQASMRPPLAVGLSASMLSDGPSCWRPFIQHMLSHTGVEKVAIPQLDGMRALEVAENDWNYIVTRSHRGEQSAKMREQLETRRSTLVEFLQHLLGATMLRRTKETQFRGKPIIEHRSAPLIELELNMPDGEVRDAHRSLCQQVKSWIDEEYTQEMQNWIDGGRVGPGPNVADFQARKLETAIMANRSQSCRAYEVIIRSSCFPAVALLYTKGDIEYNDLLRVAVNPLSIQITSALKAFRQMGTLARSAKAMADTERSIRATLEKSPFWKFKDVLERGSPKIQQVSRWIDYLVRLKEGGEQDPDLAPLGPAPPDGSRVRHLLVYGETELTVFLSFMVLFDKYRLTIDWIYLHGGTPAPERGLDAGRIQEDCGARSKIKILLGTTTIAGVALNLFRANSVFITEVTRTQAETNQAVGRVDRPGQKMKVAPFLLRDRHNLAEAVRYDRSRNRAQIAAAGYPPVLDLNSYL
ncbi:hypothetical protein F5Y05DRAFT_424050 [Hypoxylon sp. FL0543]|nr:hypothetical protein F5Y05DRAFT_424050 [Hypoxylon sp. FL0543]